MKNYRFLQKKRLIISSLSVLLLIAAIPVTTYVLQRQQTTEEHAAQITGQDNVISFIARPALAQTGAPVDGTWSNISGSVLIGNTLTMASTSGIPILLNDNTCLGFGFPVTGPNADFGWRRLCTGKNNISGGAPPGSITSGQDFNFYNSYGANPGSAFNFMPSDAWNYPANFKFFSIKEYGPSSTAPSGSTGEIRIGPDGGSDNDYWLNSGGQLHIISNDTSTDGSFTNLELGAGSKNSQSGNVILSTDGTEKMRVTPNGNVGIGTTSPQAKLSVQGGDISVSGGSFIDNGTNLNVPDYVFEPGYHLQSLSDVQSYITKNKHLPDLPSQDDTKGWAKLSLQDREMKLLEKIEQLTLYSLQQQKQIDDLKNQVQTLERTTHQ